MDVAGVRPGNGTAADGGTHLGDEQVFMIKHIFTTKVTKIHKVKRKT
jgi:hypothetical protein